ncbi:hypothetical protein G3I76_24230 [Streptomyces sp. SID11233]|nr:hypothetical protein [Streptomyces sp. SID11233]
MWTYRIDQDDFIAAEGPPGTDENVRLALETLVIPFGTSADLAETYLREWRTKEREAAGQVYTLGTPSASVTRIDPERVEIVDLYGQFRTCVARVEEFECAIACLARFLRARPF